MNNKQRISNVPANIITGFLGSGKTTAILHLLQSKPAGERWAVLVNEFGEVGVDGSLLQGQYSEDRGVFIHEVPGGCMCCAAGLPMEVALNALLTRARPDRLLIEPSGLGHPIEVLGVLSGEYYQESLAIHKTVTLVDARHLSDKRYTDHATFNQQIAIADVIVGNKSDGYQDADRSALKAYASERGAPHAKIVITEQGILEWTWLQGVTRSVSASPHFHPQRKDQQSYISDLPVPPCGSIKVENLGEGFRSIGWRFAPHRVFGRDKLFSFLSALNAERMKAVFITECGNFGYNLTTDGLTEMKLDQCAESRIEIIAPDIDATWEKQLSDCIHAN